MGNLVSNLKRFFGNKNTVTIFGVIAGIIVLWVGYDYRVKKDSALVRVPYAVKEIASQTQISSDDIKFVEVSQKVVKNRDIYTKQAEIEGMYVNAGTSIPAGGFFFKAQVVEKKALPSTVFDDIEDGYTVFSLSVNNHTTFGNSIQPGTNIDLFMKATDNNSRIIFGKLIEKINVLAVRDSSGRDVFSSTTPGTPAELLFAVPDDLYLLLMEAQYISGISIIPVPRNKNYSSQGADVITTDSLKAFIESKTSTLN